MPYLCSRIEELTISLDNLLHVLLIVLPYRSVFGFENELKIIGDKASAVFAPMSVKDQNTFYRQHRADNRDVVEYLVDLGSEKDQWKNENSIRLHCDDCR